MKLILTVFLVTTTSLCSQNYLKYYEIINSAEINSLNNNFLVADSLYQVAFLTVDKPFKEDYFLAAINANKFENEQKTYDFLKKAIEGGLALRRLKSQKDKLGYFTKSKKYKELKKEYEDLRDRHLAKLNMSLSGEISEMIKKDQSARNPIFGSIKKMRKVDNDNFKRLIEIIDANNNKWPGFSIIGEITPKGKYDVTDNIALLILHYSKEQVEMLKPYMFEAVINGEMYPYHYARIIDYKEIFNCQIYGTYLFTGSKFKSDICDCKIANDKRKEIGFESLIDFYRKVNSTYRCKE